MDTSREAVLEREVKPRYQSAEAKEPMAVGTALRKVYAGDLIGRLFGFGTAILTIRLLSVEDYAMYTAFYGIVIFFAGLVGGGINSALVRFSAEHISRTRERPLDLYMISLLLQTALFVPMALCIVFLLDEPATKLFFGQKAFGPVLKLGLMGGFGYLITQAGRSIYQSEEAFVRYIRTLWARQAVILSAVAALAFIRRLDFAAAALVVILADISVAASILIHVFSRFDFRQLSERVRDNIGMIREFLSSTGCLIAYFVALSLFGRLDIFMLSHFSDMDQLAYYGVASKYYGLALLALGSIHAVLLPRFSKVDMQDVLKQREFAAKWLKTAVWLIAPIALFDLFGKDIFLMVNGAQYGSSFYILAILSFGIWLSLMFSPLVNIMMSRKAFGFLLTLGLCAFVLNFTGNYLSIPRWGAAGAAATTVATYALINVAAAARVFISSK